MNIRPFFITTGFPDLVAPPTSVYQIPSVAFTVPRWQLGVCFFPSGNGEGRKEISSREIGGRTGCCCLVHHVV